MKVINHETGFWFLLQEHHNYYLDVNCNYSFVGFNRTIKLNEIELEKFKINGLEYINELAKEVQYHAMTKYSRRHITGKNSKSIHRAIIIYNEQNTL
ncbi:hypothetical protein [uncultured Winogradskyella sp.]|uniref:hypothetical protein n=1 Tax=uncultured Winogradskyella sp. TaxID=395353 RepID=UPI002636CE9A|nr:hypothetical protein [uncultured Winogradskyella sp.]